MLRRNAQAVPCGEAPLSDSARHRRLLQGLDGFGKARAEGRPVDGCSLRLDVVQVVEVDRLETEVLPAAVDLIAQVSRSHAVAARSDLGARCDARRDERLQDVAAG